MSAHVWTPGAAGPLDEFVSRLTRMIAAFASEHELEQAEVCIELADGSRFTLAAASPEPGFGFFSLCYTFCFGGFCNSLPYAFGRTSSRSWKSSCCGTNWPSFADEPAVR